MSQTKPKHTPGPWNVKIHGSCNDMTYKIKKNKSTSYNEACSNSALIAAAPDLLDALETVRRALKVTKDFDIENDAVFRTLYKVTNDAINKATGGES